MDLSRGERVKEFINNMAKEILEENGKLIVNFDLALLNMMESEFLKILDELKSDASIEVPDFKDFKDSNFIYFKMTVDEYMKEVKRRIG